MKLREREVSYNLVMLFIIVLMLLIYKTSKLKIEEYVVIFVMLNNVFVYAMMPKEGERGIKRQVLEYLINGIFNIYIGSEILIRIVEMRINLSNKGVVGERAKYIIFIMIMFMLNGIYYLITRGRRKETEKDNE